MKKVTGIRQLQRKLEKARRAGKKIHFVPTMGCLHDGHLRLVRAAKKKKAYVVASIFVNPLQFGPQEDFARYPRAPKRDAELLKKAGTDLLFAPAAGELLAEENTVFVDESPVSRLWCGAYRPGHFRGVLTIVAKLFHLVAPERAFFGQKDYQQWFLIRKMARELNFNCRVERVPTVREKDGLAMSSRNVYLTAAQRKSAVALVAGLRAARRKTLAGMKSAHALQQEIKKTVRRFSGAKIQYIGVASGTNLQPVGRARRGDVILLAVWLGKTRLIDNWIIGEAI